MIWDRIGYKMLVGRGETPRILEKFIQETTSSKILELKDSLTSR